MNKQEYFKMMKMASLHKAEGNVAGPLSGALLGLTAGNMLAGSVHNNPGFFTRLMYVLPLLFLGMHAGNKFQNYLNNTDRGSFWDSIDSAQLNHKNQPATPAAPAATQPPAMPKAPVTETTPVQKPTTPINNEGLGMDKKEYFKLMGVTPMFKTAAEEGQEVDDEKSAKKKKKKADKQRAKAENQASKSNRRRHGKWHSEVFGNITSPAVSAVGGGLLGALLGHLNKDEQKNINAFTGGVTGAGAGLGLGMLANLVGGAAGSIAGPRTLSRQDKYNSSTGTTIGNYLVPGMASFNGLRSFATKDEQDAVLQELLLKQKLKEVGLA